MMKSRLKIVQLSDIHISLNKNDYKNVNIVENFQKALNSGLNKSPDLLIISGDLAFKFGKKEIYHWLKEELDQLTIPYLVIPGNHDSAEMMLSYFNKHLINNQFYYNLSYNDHELIFLDSGRSIVSKEQCDWLLNLDKKLDNNGYLFMHHPPILAGCKYMDTKYPLRNIPEFQQVLTKLNNIRAIFCGHYHIAKVIKDTDFNIPVYLCPSTWYEMNEESESFKANNYNSRYYYLEIDDSGNFKVELITA